MLPGDSTRACGGEDHVYIYQDLIFPDTDDVVISENFLSLGRYSEGDRGRSVDYSQ